MSDNPFKPDHGYQRPEPTRDDLEEAARRLQQCGSRVIAVIRRCGGVTADLLTIPRERWREFIAAAEEARLHIAMVGRREWPEHVLANMADLGINPIGGEQ
jgi:hypothetical protein